MMQQITSAAYFLGAILVVLINPFLTSILVIVLYMQGEPIRVTQPLMTGFFSLAELFFYSFLIAAGIYFIKMVLQALKHPWWNRG